MKLLLINPYFGQGETEETEGATHSPPLGLGFLGTYIRDKTDWEVEIVDPVPCGLTQQQVLKRVKEANIVGLSCFADTRFYCFEFGQKIKKKYPKVKLVIGGPHTFAMDDLILKYYPFVDILVRGEGEETLLEIIQGKPLEKILGVTFRKGKRVMSNPLRPFSENIDKYYIDYSLLPPLDAYGRDVEAPLELRKLKTIYTIASRGCPFQCSYCANVHWQRRWRAISPNELVRRIKNWIRDFGVEYIRFYDDLFTANKKWVLEFCRLLKKNKIKIKFRVLVRAGTDKEVLQALKSVGCVAVGFGIESGSDKMLKRINKQITRSQIIQTIKNCQKLKLWVVGAFIISLPDETIEDYKQSLSLIPLLDTFQTNIQIIFPYTPFYCELKERGEIGDEIWFDKKHEGRLLYTKENFKSAKFSLKELEWMALYTQYYHFTHRPEKVLEKYGPFFGLLIVLIALLDTPLKGKLFHLLFKFRNFWRKIIYR
ncbi:MAG: B12-binding domain-containing radical SAM protein [Patescibacteria group bacterium]